MNSDIKKNIKNKGVSRVLSPKAMLLYEALWGLHSELRRYYKERWNRNLPFCEEVFDRWERATYLKFGKGTNIHESSIIFGNVKVGKNTWIGPFTYVDGTKEVVIGSNCSISAGVHIYSHDSVKWSLSAGKIACFEKKTVISDYCYIGANSIIRAGVTIGKRCVIGANSFVTKDVAPNSIVFGSPAKIKGKVVIRKKEISLEYFKDNYQRIGEK